MTKVIDLTSGAKEKSVLNKIELVYLLQDEHTIVSAVYKKVSNTWDSLTLLSRNYRNSYYDLMFVKGKDFEGLYLGYFNGGIV